MITIENIIKSISFIIYTLTVISMWEQKIIAKITLHNHVIAIIDICVMFINVYSLTKGKPQRSRHNFTGI